MPHELTAIFRISVRSVGGTKFVLVDVGLGVVHTRQERVAKPQAHTYRVVTATHSSRVHSDAVEAVPARRERERERWKAFRVKASTGRRKVSQRRASTKEARRRKGMQRVQSLRRTCTNRRPGRDGATLNKVRQVPWRIRLSHRHSGTYHQIAANRRLRVSHRRRHRRTAQASRRTARCRGTTRRWRERKQ